jgi:hypothetical protein
MTAEGLAAFYQAPDPAVACARGRALLLESARLWERYDPAGAAQLRYCASRLNAPQDKAAARLSADELVLKLCENLAELPSANRVCQELAGSAPREVIRAAFRAYQQTRLTPVS